MTRLGLGIFDGRFSVLALSPNREVIAAAPVVVSLGTHHGQMNGLAHIRAALRLLFPRDGMSALFTPNTLVQTEVGSLTIVDKTLFRRYEKDYIIQKLFRMANAPLCSVDISTVDVMNGSYIRTVSSNYRKGDYMDLTAKFYDPPRF